MPEAQALGARQLTFKPCAEQEREQNGDRNMFPFKMGVPYGVFRTAITHIVHRTSYREETHIGCHGVEDDSRIGRIDSTGSNTSYFVYACCTLNQVGI